MTTPTISRRTVVTLLEECAATVKKLANTSPTLHDDLRLAYSSGKRAYQIMTTGKYNTKGLATALRPVQAVFKLVADDQPILDADIETAQMGYKTISTIAAEIESTIGDGDAVLSASNKRIFNTDANNINMLENFMVEVRNASKKIAALPKTVKSGWVLAKAPIIVYTKSPLPVSALKRPGIKDYVAVPSAAGFKRQSTIKSYAYMLNDQKLIGFKSDAEIERRTRKGNVIDDDSLLARALDYIDARFGKHYLATKELETVTFTIRGNPLRWVWIVPVRSGNDFVPNVISVGSPVQSAPNADSIRVEKLSRDRMQREVEQLEKMQLLLRARGKTLPELDLIKLNSYKEELQHDLPTIKPTNLALLKAKAEAEYYSKYVKEIAELDELRLILASTIDKAGKLRISREIKALSEKLNGYKQAIFDKYRKQIR